jgi:hypothetical protein
MFALLSVTLLAVGCGPSGQDGMYQDAINATAFRTGSSSITLDEDGDTIRNILPDNCAGIVNRDQSDVDLDGFGDLCDPNPNLSDSRGLPSARGADAITAFVERIEAYQEGNDENRRIYVTMVRVCRSANLGPFACEANNLKAALSLDGEIFAVVEPDLSNSYQRLGFDLGERIDEFKSIAQTKGIDFQETKTMDALVKFWDDMNDNNEIDTNEMAFHHAHWRSYSPGFVGLLVSTTTRRGTSYTPGEESPPGEEPPCDESIGSPLVLDLGHDGFSPFSKPEVLFDLDADGKQDLVGWPTGSDDALLALDRSGDGKINSGAELFGSYTPGPDGQKMATGFEALAQYDEDGNRKIDADDEVFERLLLWQDKNGDGLSQLDELSSLSTHGVRQISLAYMSADEVDEHGNETQQRSIYHYVDPQTQELKMDIVIDVWFKMNIGPEGR